MIPHIRFERRDIEIADDQRGAVDLAGPLGHAFEEIELLPELRVDQAVGFVAAGRNIDILDNHIAARTEQFDADMAGFTIVLPVVAGKGFQRNAADRGDAVISLLPVHGEMFVPERTEGFIGELRFLAFYFLQAQHIGCLFRQEFLHQRRAQANGVDVPAGDRNRGCDHGGEIGGDAPGGKHAGEVIRQAPENRKPPSRGHWDGGSVKRSSRLASRHVSVWGNRGETHSLADLPKHTMTRRLAGK
ncbi:hypothetical protein GRI97_01465 [Altererythrobacter xixiisoli]|uniref:Uncharacterized protein n=1 Tax=Croceibacterium xixiisoli TaxID=1476466 RepID=A0A6I4TNK4_9SPHN|nr:hypothetical protein [Croceibacterium xixiisoli]